MEVECITYRVWGQTVVGAFQGGTLIFLVCKFWRPLRPGDSCGVRGRWGLSDCATRT